MCLKLKQILLLYALSILLLPTSHATPTERLPGATLLDSDSCRHLLQEEENAKPKEGVAFGLSGVQEFFGRLNVLGYLSEAHHARIMPRWWTSALLIAEVLGRPLDVGRLNSSLNSKHQSLQSEFIELERILLESARLAKSARGQMDWVSEVQVQGASPGQKLTYALPEHSVHFLRGYLEGVEFWMKRLRNLFYSPELSELRSLKHHKDIVDEQLRSLWRANTRYLVAGILPDFKKMRLVDVDSIDFYEFEFYVNEEKAHLYFVDEVYIPADAQGWVQPPHLRAILKKMKWQREVQPGAHFYLMSVKPLDGFVVESFLREARNKKQTSPVSPAVFQLMP